MSDATIDFLLGTVLGLFIGMVACFLTWGNTRTNAEEEMSAFRQRAIAHQAAHWEIGKDGVRSFHWNLPSTETNDDN